MLPTRSERLTLFALGVAALAAIRPAPLAAMVGIGAAPTPAQAPHPQAPAAAPAPGLPAAPKAATPPQTAAAARLVSSDINVSRSDAAIRLGFEGGREIEFAVRDGRMFADGSDLGAAPRGSAGEQAWRTLLAQATKAPNEQEVAGLLQRWAAPPQDLPLKKAMLAALAGQAPVAPVAAAAPAAAGAPAASSDSFAEIRSELEQVRDSMEQMREQLHDRQAMRENAGEWGGPFRYIWRGFSGIIATLVTFVILFGIGVVTVLLGGRPYIEAVADTARRHTARSWLVGLAASFLAIPAYILGALALVISIIGIPALLVWIPLFPVVTIVALIFGYLSVAHGTGEALAERRLYGGDWFRRGNSYYFLLTGLGALVALFLAAHVVEMAGPWVGFIRGLLTFLAVVTTWFAFTTGLGAVLLTRGGRRPMSGLAPMDADMSSAFEEESRV